MNRSSLIQADDETPHVINFIVSCTPVYYGVFVGTEVPLA